MEGKEDTNEEKRRKGKSFMMMQLKRDLGDTFNTSFRIHAPTAQVCDYIFVAIIILTYYQLSTP